MATIRRLTGGRAWAARLSGLLVLAAIIALIVAVVPVLADHEGALIPPESAAGVTPTQVPLGGESGDCDAITADGQFELRIENPQPGTFVTADHDGFIVTFTIVDVSFINEDGWRGERMSWTLNAAGTDLIVKGGSESAHYDYTDATHGGSGAVGGDSGNHATAQNRNRLHAVSHATVCYDVVATIDGLKYRDHDQNGRFGGDADLDAQESFIGGWIINLYEEGNAVAIDSTTTSVVDGKYFFPGLALGVEYTVCEADPGGGQWSQKNIGGTWDPNACGGNGEEEGGHVFVLSGDTTAAFGNFSTVDVGCGFSQPVGEHTITIPTVASGLCDKNFNEETKEYEDVEYVLESYIRVNEDQVHDFHPIDGATVTGNAHVSEVHVWSVDQIQNSSTLMYDDDKGAGTQTALYCNHDPTTAGVLDANKLPPLGPDPLTAGHTTCIITSTEGPNAAGDDVRTDVLYSLIDGRRWV